MKKTYIKPENVVAVIDVEKMIAQSTQEIQRGGDYNGSATIEAREVINTPDAWEEW